ncbi:MAG: 3-oxoacyl-ACP reductase family protein [Pseudomonadota bacterium]|nr:3-oxoacyl-ACP reductase family protein [Pseudomonadota bacterium]
MGRLEGRVALITGAAQGIGAAFAKGLAAEGAKVAISDLDSGQTVVDIIKQAGGEAIDAPCDVSDETSAEKAVQQTVEAFGRLDILVNNAAIFTMVDRKNFDKISVSEWDRVSAVNIKGVWLMCKAAVPEMRKNKYGKIISISSGRAFKGSTHFLHYDASKAAVVGITRSLARELGDDNICVNAIAPGGTASENVLKRNTDLGSSMESTVATRALKRIETPEDLVGACLFLASSDSDFITGQSLVVDGGSAMH